MATETPKLNLPLSSEIVTESGLARIPENPYIFMAQHHLWRFREAFPNQSYFQFFSKLKHIANRYLSRDERDAIINSCLRLIEAKEHVKTAHDFRRQLSWEAEDRKRVIAVLENIHSLTDQLAESISSLEYDPKLKDIKEAKYFCNLLYEQFDIYSSVAPIKPALRRIWQTSGNMIKEYTLDRRRGPPPDVEVARCISILARIWGREITAGYNVSEERRTSPFIEFVKTILLALPRNALMGREGFYTDAAIEEHINRLYKAKYAKRRRGRTGAVKARKNQ